MQICHKIDTKDVYTDVCIILTSHLKEYRKALKRREKSTETVESLYKKVHPTSDTNKKITTTDHCTNLLRIILKELVPWELWDTPHSELLVRIMSKKLDSFVTSTLVDPVWLNDKLLTFLKGNKEIIKSTAKKTEKKEETVRDEELIEDSSPLTKTATLGGVGEGAKDPGQKYQKAEGKVEEAAVISQPSDAKLSPILRQRRGRQGRNEVKIYDRVIEGIL